MKNKLSILLLGVCLLGASACSDQFLEEKRDYNNMIPIDVYSDPAQANAVFATIYKYMLGKYNSPLCGADVLMRQAANTGGLQYFYSEEIPGGYLSSDFTSGKFTGANDKNTKAGNHIANPPYWNYPRSDSKNFNDVSKGLLFPAVFLINNFITEIDRSGRVLYDNQTFWDNLKGQAIFARAWLYFDGVRLLGGVPYYNTENDQAQPGDRSERMPMQDCIDKICADFETAATLLPAKWDAENEGRFTSVAALAMAGKARLFMASPVFNANWDDTNSKRWAQALEACKKALDEANKAGYGTSVTSIDTWDKSFYSFANTTFNPEAIIKVPKSDNSLVAEFNKWEGYIRPGVVNSSTAAGIPAADQIIQLFPMKDGRRATAANGYNDEKFYRDRDPRFYRTIAFSGCQWPGTTTQIWLYAYKFSATQFRYTEGSAGDGGAMKKSRAIVWKMSDPKVTTGSESTQGTDILEFRYAELLLNLAECYAATGKIGEATTLLNQIRNRVGAGAVPTPADKYAAIEAVLYERAVELAYEGKRVWDMKRWLLYEGGAGFDPRFAIITESPLQYDPDLAWGSGWKLYNGKEGRPAYTKQNNVLTRLQLPRFSGTRHTSKVWGYQLSTINAISETGYNHPLKNDPALKAVPAITREMSESARNAAFDKLEDFYTSAGLVTVAPEVGLGPQYGMDMGTSIANQNFLFAWRGWYNVYPIHYDAYTLGKGNDWLTQTEGWMTANASPAGVANIEEQDGKYVYCTAE